MGEPLFEFIPLFSQVGDNLLFCFGEKQGELLSDVVVEDPGYVALVLASKELPFDAIELVRVSIERMVASGIIRSR